MMNDLYNDIRLNNMNDEDAEFIPLLSQEDEDQTMKNFLNLFLFFPYAIPFYFLVLLFLLRLAAINQFSLFAMRTKAIK